MVASPLPEAITSGQLARAIGVSERVILGRKSDGRLPSHASGGIDLAVILQAGVVALAVEQRGGSDGPLDLNTERARLANLQADAQAMKNDMTRGDLIPARDVVAGMQAAFANARAKLLSLPSKAAPLVAGEDNPAAIRDILTGIVHDACGELAATRAIPVATDRTDDGGSGDGGDGDMVATTATDGERVGRSKPRSVGRGKRGAG